MNGYEPWEGQRTGAYFWTLELPRGKRRPSDLPLELFDLLPEPWRVWGVAAGYPTRQAALQALAAAMGRAEKQ